MHPTHPSQPTPPTQQPHPTHQPHPTELYYSNEDVQILHDIVILAQELLPNLPERERLPTNALFNAYYDILPRAGIDADHDSRYARILFKIGGLRGPGTLFQKFEDVLDRMGIDIQFSGGSGEEDNDQLDDSQTGHDTLTTDGTSPQRGSPRRRCSSETLSTWDISHSPSKPRSNSLPNVQQLEGHYTLDTSNSLPNVQQAEGHYTLDTSNSLPNIQQPEGDHTVDTSNSLSSIQQPDGHLDEQLAAKLRRRQLAMQAVAKLRDWKAKALQAQQKREELEEIAENHDREALLQSALEAWRNRLREQQEEELRNTSIARKFWDIWREKVEDSKKREQLAAAMYKRNLLRNLAAKMGRAKAPPPAGLSPAAQIIARKFWDIWRETVEDSKKREQLAAAMYKRNLLRSLAAKMGRAKVPQAAGHSPPTHIVPEVPQIKVPQIVELSPPKTHNIISKVPPAAGLSATISHWRERSTQEALATKVDRTKLLKEAITVWRQKTRLAEMRDRIDDRIKGQALRAWILAARSKLAEYRKKESSLRMCLRAWKSRQEMAAAQRQEREEMAQSFASRQSANLVLRQWYSKMGEQQRNETAALDFHAPRLVSTALTKWTDKSKHIQHLEQRSRDADFYFLASRSLKAWKAATEASKREKRKQAYVQVRRNGKVNLAKAVLEKWRSKARPIMELQAQALKARQDRDIILAIDIFDRWRARTDYMQGLGVEAEEHVLRKHLISWKDRLKDVEAVDTEASLHYQEAQESKHFKKWGLKTLQIRAHNNTAAEVREKNSKRNVRRIFGYWRQRAELRKQEHKEEDIPPNVPPIPGYLNTPSRRSVRFTTTTPRAPLSTPAERRLRAQWS